jgi:hypothetical protein
MILQIFDSLTIEEVQERFNECFPYLKLAFYSKPHKIFQPSDDGDEYISKIRLSDIRKNHDNGVLEIKSWYKTARVEADLKEYFDLNAQVLRLDLKSNSWVQTYLSDNLTLKEQTMLAKEGYLKSVIE